MKSRFITGMALVCAGIVSAHNASLGVVTLASGKLFTKTFGSGICVDTPCLHVLTSYHVMALLGSGLKVQGVRVVKIVSATGAQEPGSMDVNVAGSIFRYNPSKDLALLTLSRPLPSGFVGLRFAGYKPPVGQQVTRIARYHDAYDVEDGTVIADEVQHHLPDRIVHLDRHFLLNCGSRPGNSGGAVTDSEGRVLGVIQMRTIDGSGRVGTAVMSASVVSDFLYDKDRVLWANLFHEVESTAIPAPIKLDWPVTLDSRPVVREGTRDPKVLTAALLSKVTRSVAEMQRMSARQSTRLWGDREEERAWAYEVAMYSDGQRFRTAAGKDVDPAALPAPRRGIIPESEWYEILSGLQRVELEYLGSSTHSGEPVHVFLFQHAASDEVYQFRQRKYGLFGSKDVLEYVSCQGIIVSDEHFNIMGISLRFIPHSGFVADWQAIASYGLTNLHDGSEPYLVPLSLEMSTRLKNGKTYYASERWSDYHLFMAESSLRAQ